MSSVLIETPASTGSTNGPEVAASRTNSDQSISPWRWMILACLLLGLSGGWRAWREYQFARLNTESKDCPFPLSELPKSLGTWVSIDDTDGKLDPEIAKIAGSTDHIIRTYVESRTGEKVQVLLLYGLAQDVFGHTPEICYPASGSQAVSRTLDADLNKLRDKDSNEKPEFPGPTIFRSQIYLQPLTTGNQYTEVFYAFRHGGHWKPDMAGEWKTFRYQPGMFKIQTSRQVSAAAASPNATSPGVTESLVGEIVKDLERRLASANAAAKNQG